MVTAPTPARARRSLTEPPGTTRPGLHSCRAGDVAERQTRRTQNPLTERWCGFDSHRPHALLGRPEGTPSHEQTREPSRAAASAGVGVDPPERRTPTWRTVASRADDAAMNRGGIERTKAVLALRVSCRPPDSPSSPRPAGRASRTAAGSLPLVPKVERVRPPAWPRSSPARDWSPSPPRRTRRVGETGSRAEARLRSWRGLDSSGARPRPPNGPARGSRRRAASTSSGGRITPPPRFSGPIGTAPSDERGRAPARREAAAVRARRPPPSLSAGARRRAGGRVPPCPPPDRCSRTRRLRPRSGRGARTDRRTAPSRRA